MPRLRYIMIDRNGYDSILLIGFGGPTSGCCKKYATCPGEAYCFVEGIIGTAEVNAERVQAVTSHYLALGGFSPFNELTFKQADALEVALKARGVDVPIYVGMRNWRPYLREVIAEMCEIGHQRVLGVILSAYQSSSSWERYQNDVKAAIDAVDGWSPAIRYLDAWHTRPGFVNAIASRVREACADIEARRFDRASLIFTAHALPQPAAKRSPYTKQFRQTASAVAAQLGKDFDIAYQSAPDNPTVPWTTPDINDLIRTKKEAGFRDVIVSPIGFLCCHVEVLYDLGVEAKATAEACDIDFVCTETVGDHPEFIGMLTECICERFQGVRKNG